MKTAAYTRYSSDEQRASSNTDQLRNINNHCQRLGWPAPTHYADEAVSGALHSRPGLDRMMAAAEHRTFDVLIVDDLTRLGRDMAETPRLVKLLKYWGIRLIGVSDGVDTERAGYKIEIGLRGIMAEAYLDDLADKTHRGLTGLALQGYSAGGLPYGYTSEHDGHGHQRRINPAQAEVVREIFNRYASGHTPRAIAAELNRRHIEAPRGGTWAQTAIGGDRKRGIGMLNNPIYIGQQIWNRSKWIKDPMTGRRKRHERQPTDWIITEAPSLAIIEPETWQAVKARQAELDRRNHQNPRPAGTGRPPKYIFSGLMKCGHCGANMVIVDGYRYGCAAHKDRGWAVCDNSAKIPRARLESMLIENIRRDLDNEQHYKTFEKEARRLLAAHANTDTSQARETAKRATREIENIMAAIKAGIVTETTLRELKQAELDKRTAEAELAAVKSADPEQLLPRARETYQRLIEQISTGDDITERRQAIKETLGEITLTRRKGGVWADFARRQSEINVVAGARFVNYLTITPPPIKVADDKPSPRKLQAVKD